MALVNSLWLSLSKHGFLWPNLHIAGPMPKVEGGGPGLFPQRRVCWQLEPHLSGLLGALVWAQFPLLENKAGGPGPPTLPLCMLAPGSMAHPLPPSAGRAGAWSHFTDEETDMVHSIQLTGLGGQGPRPPDSWCLDCGPGYAV